MGLDNIPKEYACKKQGTAVMVERKDKDGNPLIDDDGSVMTVIDCQATQECGGCPWKNHFQGMKGHVMGIFGTDCWYRGKYGNALLGALGFDTDEISFYGDEEDGTVKTPKSCLELADHMETSLMEDEIYWEGWESEQEVITDAKYAIEWLKWVAKECEGSVCWY
jgi:hypothetical protein